MKRILLLAFAALSVFFCKAQTHWINPLEAGAVVHGQGWEDIRNTYTRLPDRAKEIVRPVVWNLSRQSAGLSLAFRSNAGEMTIRFQVSGDPGMFHMPSTGVSGVDLFAIDEDGDIRQCAPDFPPSFGDTIVYKYSDITFYKEKKFYDYKLYLPLYNSLKWLEIGIPDGTSVTFRPESAENPVVIYGTSIIQGGCASRPGMAWTNIIERELDHPVVNFGFSGNGTLDPEIFSLMAEIDARMYVIDCMPNMIDREDTESRIVEGVRILREKHDCPILLMEHCGYSNGVTRVKSRDSYSTVNDQLRRGYDRLISDGVEGLFYMTMDEIGLGPDGQVEGVHLTDLGMRRVADNVEEKIRRILNEETVTFKPARQSRAVFNWNDRHEEVLSAVSSEKPDVVLIGDSIIHFWGGEPVSSISNGPDSWSAFWRGQNVLNLGFGWDRIENVLWRINHGELDGWDASEIIILVGTNNIGINSPEEIAGGIAEIARSVRVHQKESRIIVCGILPRSDVEVSEYNKLISRAIGPDAEFVDVGSAFMTRKGGIDEDKFNNDGLHPNESGYEALAESLASLWDVD